LVTNIAGVELFNLSESGFITLAPISLLITGPITLPQKLPIFTLNERKGRASNIKVMHDRDQKPSQVKPIINLIRNDTGPTFLDSAMFEILVVTF
jgi:hypothetical protein